MLTMAEHMESVYKEKFGVKSIINDFLLSLVTSLNEYESLGVDFYVFNKVLHHSLPEDFHELMRQVRKTLLSLYYLYLALSNPELKESDLQALLARTLHGTILTEEAIMLLNNVYSDEDAGLMAKIIHTFST